MSVILLGVSHHSAPIALLERLAVTVDEGAKVLKELTALDHVLEAVVLSTCNRVEVYAHVTRFHPGLDELRHWFADRAGMSTAEFDRGHFARYDEQAAQHLFAVASGIDSMVVGERQITLQVKQAAELARVEGASRRVLQKLFRQAAAVARRVRAETHVADGAASMVSVGLEGAAEALGGDLCGRTVLLVGAGKMGGLSATRLREADVGRVLVWNRSVDTGTRLAKRINGELVPDALLHEAIAVSDLVVTTTGAAEPVVSTDLVARALNMRTGDVAGKKVGGEGQKLVLLDLSMPHNVDPGCATYPGVELIGIAKVRELADAHTETGAAVQAARVIVADEAARFGTWTRATVVDPSIKALRKHASDVRESETQRLAARLAGLDEKQRAAVDSLTQGIINTLLHQPTLMLRELADRGGAEHHVNLLRELFDLADED